MDKRRILRDRIIALVISLLVWGFHLYRNLSGRMELDHIEIYRILIPLVLPLAVADMLTVKNVKMIYGDKSKKYRIMGALIWLIAYSIAFFIPNTASPQYALYVVGSLCLIGYSLIFFFEMKHCK